MSKVYPDAKSALQGLLKDNITKLEAKIERM